MKSIISLIFLLLSFDLFAQNIIYQAEKGNVQFGKYKYEFGYESFYHHEEKLRGFTEILVLNSKKQYIGTFIYQLKNDTEMTISPEHPPRPQLVNRIIESSDSIFDYENERIIVTTYYHDEKEPRAKEVKTLKQRKTGFFYIEKRVTYFKNGEVKEENNFSKKIELVKVPH